MNAYIITYDLTDEKDYPKLKKAILELSENCKHILDSTWIVITNKTTEEIQSIIEDAIDNDDMVFIARIKNTAHLNLDRDSTNWLNQNT